MEHNFTWKNDGRTKVMIGCGTRPEIIRLAAVIKRCREYLLKLVMIQEMHTLNVFMK